MDGICDNKDLIYIRKTGSLINTTSYSEKFSFSRCNIYYMIYSLNDWIIMAMDVQY